MGAVFGGVGNLWGTLIGGMTLGVIRKLLELYAGAVLAKDLGAVALIVFIQNRPRGPSADRPRRRGVLMTNGRSPFSTLAGLAAAPRFSCSWARWIVVPVLNLATLPGSILHLTPDVLRVLIGKDMCYAMLAMAVDLIWGYCGILEPRPRGVLFVGRIRDGHVSDAPDRSAWGVRQSVLPDFMVFLNWEALPWFWYGFDHSDLDGDGRVCAGPLPHVWMVCVPIACHWCVFVDHHPGAQLRPDARVLPKRHGLRWEQRLHRFQGDARSRPPDAPGSH